jgi:ferritin-like metal-binding protein YciE
MKELNNLNDLLIHKVQSLYVAESLQIQALQNMMDKTNHKELRQALEQHLQETQTQKQRLEEVGNVLQVDLQGGQEQGIRGLIEEGEGILNVKGSPEVLNAAIIANVQAMEHYEIAAYGTACYLADELALQPVSDILKSNLQEEKATDQKLNELAKTSVNIQAEKLEQV